MRQKYYLKAMITPEELNYFKTTSLKQMRKDLEEVLKCREKDVRKKEESTPQ